VDRRDSTHDAARSRHDTVFHASDEPIRARRRLESVGAPGHAPPHTHAGRTSTSSSSAS